MSVQFTVLINQGEDYSFSVRWPGEDLSAASAKMQFRTSPGADVLAEFSSPSDGIVFSVTSDAKNPDNHVDTLRVTVSAAASRPWTFTRAVHDLLLTLASGKKLFLVRGPVMVVPQVTV